MPVVRLTAWPLRKVFDKAGLWAAYQRGELQLDVQRDRPPARANKQPPGTRSITAYLVRIEPNGRRRKVAFVHYYLLPDGTINNTANAPDPKWCLVNGVRYVLRP